MRIGKFMLMGGILSLLLCAAMPLLGAPKGGSITIRFGGWPKGFNYYTDNAVETGLLAKLTHISLIDNSEVDYSTIPMLAKSWQVKNDKKTMVFHLRPNVTFADGSKVTAEDVKFSYELLYDQKKCVKCEALRSGQGEMEYIKIIDPLTIEIKAKKVHFANVERFGTLPILAKAHYSKGDFNRDYELDLFGAGPYVYNEKASTFRKTIVLNRRSQPYYEEDSYFKDRFNFDKITIKYIEDNTVAFEAFKKKDLDIYHFELGDYRLWDDQKQAPFTEKNVVRVTAPWIYPSSWAGIALNMRKGPLSDLNFRRALQYAFNRELMIGKVFQNHFRPVAGVFAYKSKYSADLPENPYDPAKAAELLKKAGFTSVDSDGVLYREITEKGLKQKQRASITVLYAAPDHELWLTIYKQDAKKLGVEINPRQIDWSAGTKLLDEFQFEGFVIGWEGDPIPVPDDQWTTVTANIPSSSNICGFSNKRVDQLVDLAPATMDLHKRVAMFKEMEKLIMDEQPYVFRWSDKQHLVAYWKDRVAPGAKPFYDYSGSLYRLPFFLHWYKAN